MTLQQIVLATMIVALVGAEAVRPTSFAAKRIEYRTASGGGALDRLELDDLPPIVQPALGNIDVATVRYARHSRRFVQDATVERGAVLHVVGWCADPLARARGAALIVIVDRAARLNETAAYAIARPDVARALGNPAALVTGYDVALPTSHMETGPHAIQIAVVLRHDRSIAIFPVPLRFSIER